MHIELRFFAALRERLGVAAERCELPAGVNSTSELRSWLAARGQTWSDALGTDRNVRVALDQRLVKDDATLHDGAEVAFFPPVTGG